MLIVLKTNIPNHKSIGLFRVHFDKHKRERLHAKPLIVGLENINTDAFMWQQFLAEDLRVSGQQLCYLPTLQTEYCAVNTQNTTREKTISLQLTGWVTACPLTQGFALQKTTILYFQRPFLTGWCFLWGEKKNKRTENIWRRNTSICWLFLVRLLHCYQ